MSSPNISPAAVSPPGPPPYFVPDIEEAHIVPDPAPIAQPPLPLPAPKNPYHKMSLDEIQQYLKQNPLDPDISNPDSKLRRQIAYLDRRNKKAVKKAKSPHDKESTSSGEVHAP
jgi:hypothetical protein